MSENPEDTIPLPVQRIQRRETVVTIPIIAGRSYRIGDPVYIRGPFGIIHNKFGAYIKTGQPIGLWAWIELNRRNTE